MSALQRTRLGVSRRDIGGTLVWGTVVAADSTPLRGAGAGALTALGSLFVFAALAGLFAGLGVLFGGAPLDAPSSFVNITTIVFVVGGVYTAVLTAPLAPLVGYAYEWLLARRRDASLGSRVREKAPGAGFEPASRP